ncbi:vWA domain-containing protein [Sessilibacter corallicola]|uniref:vWA domain-containing protein n=1 Tax=Sessilibacter corallicola TaxID=2904075 RepID=UPI001E2F4E48|nr:VWA domain-containing protein [Sessilibacter corallicola]MCE2028337.1 VWA domain-containing protein [Sessilibacter corallicola]
MNSSKKSDELDNLFSTMPNSPSHQRKQHDKDLAMQAFMAAQSDGVVEDNVVEDGVVEESNANRQGIFQRLRLTLKSLMNEGDKMTKRWVYSGAIAAVFVVGLSVTVLKNSETYISESYTSESYVSESYKPENTQEYIAPTVTPLEHRAVTENQQEIMRQFSDNSVDSAVSEALIESDTNTVFEAELSRQEPIVGADSVAAVPQLSSSPVAPQSVHRSRTQAFAEGTELRTITSKPIIDDSIVPEVATQNDRFKTLETNPVKKVNEQPVSTFSVDVDTSSYSYVRSQLNSGVLPKKDSVRLEEMVNYFDYSYPSVDSADIPFRSSITVVDSPWKSGNKLIHIGINGYELPKEKLPRSNLVFLLDVSGSMNQANKLPLVKQSFELMLSQLQEDDTVAIVVYAGQVGTVLEPTPVKEKDKILQAIKNLTATGSTAGAQGIQRAYELAETQFDKKAVNRIILATDGDFNVGITNVDELKGFVERKREQGIFLSVLGFGRGNYHDTLMQELAQNGNGVAAYIDTLGEAQKVLVEQASAMLFTIAKDVKLQVEFNPATVSEYRLLGYETRALATEDFSNDKVDAGDIGSGHSVTAVYEITPVGSESGLHSNSRYSDSKEAETSIENTLAKEYGFLKIRYKLPNASTSNLIEMPILKDQKVSQVQLREANFSIAVAGFAQVLRGGKYTGEFTYDDVINLAQTTKGDDLFGYRTEFIQLVRKAKIAKEF